MAISSISLYGDDSRGYMALMGHYASNAAYRFTYILNYFNMELPPYEVDLGPFDDPPWKRPKTHFNPLLPLEEGDDISILLYIPIHRDETLSVHGEMIHVETGEVIAQQPLEVYVGGLGATASAADLVHFSISADDIWRHARIEFTAAAAVAVGAGVENLHDYIRTQGIPEAPGVPEIETYYLFRLRIVSSHGGNIFHREENGFLMVGP